MTEQMSRSSRLLGCLALALALLAERPAFAGNGGEGRSILREPDRPYTVVAGDADASATVQNPANLAFLGGFEAILDMAINSPTSGRRGNGVGVFAAVPLPWQILALGVGVQAMWRSQASPLIPDVASADDPFGKFTVALALPLMRWVPGLSLGVQYSRLFADSNDLASRTNQVDVALTWRANRYLAMALVARHLNNPRLGSDKLGAPVLDPELALRPFGDSRLELALGMRMQPAQFDRFSATDGCVGEVQVLGCVLEPRGRVLFGVRGVRVYAEAEGLAYLPSSQELDEPDAVHLRMAVRLSAGLQFDTPHFGIAAGPSAALATGGYDGLHGVNARVRLSHARRSEALQIRPRRVTRLSLAGKRDDRDLAELLWTLGDLARRGNAVVLVELHGSGFATAQLEELREALLRVQASGGRVVAYLEGGSLSHYFLASVADRIIAHPHTALSIIGLATRTLYWGELLARLGITAEFVRIAEYKGTPERWSQPGPSAPVAEANRVLLTDIWNHLVRSIARSRAHDPAVISEWVDQAPWQPDDAQRAGLIDDVAYPDQLDEKLEAWLGRPLRIEPPPDSPITSVDWAAPAHVALLHVHGDLVGGESVRVPLLGIELAGSDTLTKQIAALRDDRSVKAVVVRIDSRGGSVRAAQAIARELDRTREIKPVVISMGKIAASGGYYIATAGQYIFADATTQTGSIGIFHPKLDLSGLLDKLGVHADILAIGDRATMRSNWKPYTDDERAAAFAAIAASYDTFIDRVAAARAMTPEAADAVARGRVWSGVRAIEVGLVDRYGGMSDAVERAAQMAGLTIAPGGAPTVIQYPPSPTLLQQIRSLFGLQLPLPLSAGAASEQAAIGFADPMLRALRVIPAALWYTGEPEALAIGEGELDIEG
jgi:protease-4